jgi:hypothetical protein
MTLTELMSRIDAVQAESLRHDFTEGQHEIRQIAHSGSEQDETELKPFSNLVRRLGVERRPEDERTRNIPVLGKPVAARRWRGLKNQFVRACLAQGAAMSVTAIGHAHKTSKRDPERSPQTVAFVERGQFERFTRADREHERKNGKAGECLFDVHCPLVGRASLRGKHRHIAIEELVDVPLRALPNKRKVRTAQVDEIPIWLINSETQLTLTMTHVAPLVVWPCYSSPQRSVLRGSNHAPMGSSCPLTSGHGKADASSGNHRPNLSSGFQTDRSR